MPPAAAQGQQAQQRRPTRWLLWAAGTLLVTFAAIAIALGVVYGTGSDKAPAAGTGPSTIVPQSVSTSGGVKDADLVSEAGAATVTGAAAAGSQQQQSTQGTFSNADLKTTTTTTMTGGINSVLKPITNTGAGALNASAVVGQASQYGIPATNEKLLAALAIASGAVGGGNGDGTCRVANAEELRAAITEKTCPVVILTNPARHAYVILEEIVVRRAVVVMGNSVTLPYLDCAEAVRAFRVVAGGYLELQFVRVNIGQGEVRPRVGIFRDRNLQTDEETEAESDASDENLNDDGVWREMTEEDYEAMSPEERAARKLQLGGQGAEAPPLSVIEIRGGTVLFEPGAIGGAFTGVYFTSDQTDLEDVQIAIDQTLNLVGIRIWGGHVMIADGDVTFNGCIFYDLELLTPLSDRIYFGGDVLVVAGTARFTACAWFYTTVIGMENGLGFNVAAFAGATIFTACHFQEQNGAAAYNGVGQAFIVLGGVQIVTGCNFVYFSCVEFFSGTGELTVIAGVQVVTGVSWEEFYGVFAYYGAGLDYAVIAGVLVMTGASVNQWSGPIWGSVAGDYVFVGAGSYTAHGCPVNLYASVGGETGSGCLTYVATGTAVFVGAPIFDVAAIWTTFAIGEYYGLSSGFLVILGNPFIEITAIEYFQGLGGTCFMGAGAAVMGWSPQIEMVALGNEHFDFWLMRSCEPEHGAYAPGRPFYVPPLLGCIEHSDEEHAEEEPHAGEEHEEHEEDGGRRKRGLRRARALATSLAGLGDLLLDSTDLSLLAVNMTKTTLVVDDAAQRRFLDGIRTPNEVIAAAREIQSLKDALAAGGIVPAESSASGDAASSFYVEGQLDGFCGMCNSGSVSGPGAGSCEVADSCNSLMTPFGGSAAQVLDYDAMDYKEHFIVAADLDTIVPVVPVDGSAGTAGATGGAAGAGAANATATAAASKSPLTAEDVKEAILESLAVEGEAGDLEALQVTVHDAQADPILKAHFPEYFPDLHDRALSDFHRRMAADLSASLEDGTELVAQRFKVMIVATSREASDAVLAKMTSGEPLDEDAIAAGVVEPSAAASAGGDTELEAGLVDYLALWKDIDVGATRLTLDKTWFVPAYNSKDLFNDASTDNAAASGTRGSFSVSLLDPSQPGAGPVTHPAYGGKYTARLENFPPNGKVSVRLHKVGSDAASWAVAPDVPVDAAGKAAVPLSFQPFRHPAGEYFLNATEEASGIYNFSPVFTLAPGKRRRKLYGPVMWV